MEKIKVNMTPCEEVKTIHASQNDNATRKWAFDLYDENGKIDSSDIKEQMIFDSRVGGTEQILPENTSNPTTSPIIADIQYPDSLRSEQTFLYRESPTTVNGQAKIARIKGNTVVFNQLVQNGNFADVSAWSTPDCSYTVSCNVASLDVSVQYGRLQQEVGYAGSVYYYHVELKRTSLDEGPVLTRFRLGSTNLTTVFSANNTDWQTLTGYGDLTASTLTNALQLRIQDERVNRTTINVRNVFVINVTRLLGRGNEPLTKAEFETWLSNYYPLPYYDYTLGKLLPFKGEELKTTNADETETNVLSLPTLTYFPTGMKDCSQSSQVFDEKTESKAITRVGSVDLGTPTWTYYTGGAEPVFYTVLDNLVQGVEGQIGNIKCPLYNVISSRTRDQFATYASDLDMQITANARTVMIKNLTYTSAESFKTAMRGVYLYYELATPTEESITTASLVTEKGETPLYYDDELIADCNEAISSESEIFDAKIKLMSEETIYSQKIQLHVERKPQ